MIARPIGGKSNFNKLAADRDSRSGHLSVLGGESLVLKL